MRSFHALIILFMLNLVSLQLISASVAAAAQPLSPPHAVQSLEFVHPTNNYTASSDSLSTSQRLGLWLGFIIPFCLLALCCVINIEYRYGVCFNRATNKFILRKQHTRRMRQIQVESRDNSMVV
jgi:hypothetical protein